MRSVIWLILIFAGAVVAAAALNHNDGLVSIFWSGWRVDTSLNVFVIGVVLFVLAVYAALRTVNALLSMPARAHEWRMLKRERAAHAALRAALADFLAARYNRAARSAQLALDLQGEVDVLRGEREFAGLAHLVAASARHRMQDRRGRDELAQRAVDLVSASLTGSAVLDGAWLLMAEWALDDRDAQRGLECLAALPPGAARRTQALRLRLQAARLARRPLEALQTARLLAKHQGFSVVAAQSLLRSLAVDVVTAARDDEEWLQAWKSLETADRRDIVVAARAAVHAQALGRPDLGREVLQPLWGDLSRLDPDERGLLATALADCVAGIGSDWLPRVESALSTCGHEPTVVAVAGIVFGERQLWGKARRPLEQSAQHADLPARLRREALRRLAFIARLEGDADKGSDYERRAASID